jgi:hypothetical protein
VRVDLEGFCQVEISQPLAFGSLFFALFVHRLGRDIRTLIMLVEREG